MDLIPPTTVVHRSYLAALAEFRAGGRLGADDYSMLARAVKEVRR
jgi:hypothetical protein